MQKCLDTMIEMMTGWFINTYLVDSYFLQKPPAPRKVGTPDSALTPAPVKMTIFFDLSKCLLKAAKSDNGIVDVGPMYNCEVALKKLLRFDWLTQFDEILATVLIILVEEYKPEH